MSKEGGGGAEKKQSSTGRDERGVPQPKSPSGYGQEPTSSEQHVAGVIHSTARTEESRSNVSKTSVKKSMEAPNTGIAEPSKETTMLPPEGDTTSNPPDEVSRQVIAVSASKKPAVFFNLARKFLATDDECDLSALEGAILTAVDAAHLLERSKIAKIVRIQTSYVSVEPKRRKNAPTMKKSGTSQFNQESAQSSVSSAILPAVVSQTSASISSLHSTPVNAIVLQGGVTSKTQDNSARQRKNVASGRAKGVPLRRARIVITVRRTEDYKKWLEETPYEAIVAGEDDMGDEEQEKLKGQIVQLKKSSKSP